MIGHGIWMRLAHQFHWHHPLIHLMTACVPSPWRNGWSNSEMHLHKSHSIHLPHPSPSDANSIGSLYTVAVRTGESSSFNIVHMWGVCVCVSGTPDLNRFNVARHTGMCKPCNGQLSRPPMQVKPRHNWLVVGLLRTWMLFVQYHWVSQ